MTLTTEAQPSQLSLTSRQTAIIPVPEGRLVLATVDRAGTPRALVTLEPHVGESHELAIFQSASISAADMLTVALAALDAWR